VEPPPPQDAIVAIAPQATSNMKADCQWRFLREIPPKNTIPSKPAAVSPAGTTNGLLAAAPVRAIVVIVRVVATGPPFGVTGLGENEQCAPCGSAEQVVKVTALLNPGCGFTVIV